MNETNTVQRSDCCAPSTASARTEAIYRPNVDIRETENAYRVDLDLPGAERDAIDIRFEEGVLLVEAPVRERGLGENGAWLQREYAVDPNAIEARFEQGVLTLSLPKTEAARPVRIKVQGG
jgi:HSP20 family protein